MIRKLIPAVATVFLFSFCNKPTQTDICDPNGDTVAWDECVEMLNSGCVEGVGQAHSLDVYLTLKNNRSVKTREPSIDMIFVEIDKCGEKCRDISQATE